MTVVNGIEIDCFNIKPNTINLAIKNNDPIEEKLHVVAVVSNPCLYSRRYILMNEFIKRMEETETNIILYIVELCYGDQQFVITDKENKRHLQLRTAVPLWHKENMINLGVKYLLPATWKAFAWIDADIEFESSSWASDTLKLLNGSHDIVQLFSHAVDMDRQENAMSIFSSFGFQFSKGKHYSYARGINYWHPGYAWAITKKAYMTQLGGGLYEEDILGSGDHHMAMSIITCLKGNEELREKMKHLRLGYVPGVIRHYFHGTKVNRRYVERNEILYKHAFNFQKHITSDAMGLLIPSSECPAEFQADILKYFVERKEDD